MTRRLAVLAALSLGLCLVSAASAQSSAPTSAPAKRRVAVADFSVTGDVGIAEAGKAVSELLIAELGGGSAFQVVERSQLTSILQEHKLSMSEIVDNPALLAQHLKGVSHLVTGSVVKLGSLSISARLVDVKTGDIVQTAKVSARDAQGLEAALGDLARQISGQAREPEEADPLRKPYRPMTLELNAADYGRIVWKDQALRCGPKDVAVLKDFPPLDKLRFHPDGTYKAGDRVKSTVELTVGKPARKLPAGTNATVVADANQNTDDGPVYVVKWEGMEDSPQRVAKRYIEPVSLPSAAVPVELSPWYYERSRLRGVFIWDCTVTGSGVRPVADKGLDPWQVREAGYVAAAADAISRICEKALRPKVTTVGKRDEVSFQCDFNSVKVASRTTIVDFKTDTYTVELVMIGAKPGERVTVNVSDFLLQKPAQLTGYHPAATLRDYLTILCQSQKENAHKDDAITEVTVTFTGIVAFIEK
jgi:TolB-like protein